MPSRCQSGIWHPDPLPTTNRRSTMSQSQSSIPQSPCHSSEGSRPCRVRHRYETGGRCSPSRSPRSPCSRPFPASSSRRGTSRARSTNTGTKPATQRTLHFYHRTLLILLLLHLMLLLSMGLLLALKLLKLLRRRWLGQQSTCNRICLASRHKRIEFPLLGPHIPKRGTSRRHINPRNLKKVVRRLPVLVLLRKWGLLPLLLELLELLLPRKGSSVR